MNITIYLTTLLISLNLYSNVSSDYKETHILISDTSELITEKIKEVVLNNQNEYTTIVLRMEDRIPRNCKITIEKDGRFEYLISTNRIGFAHTFKGLSKYKLEKNQYCGNIPYKLRISKSILN